MDAGTDYQKVQIKTFPAKSIRDTAEGRYWRRFQAPKTTEQVRNRAAAPMAPARLRQHAILHVVTYRYDVMRTPAARCLLSQAANLPPIHPYSL